VTRTAHDIAHMLIAAGWRRRYLILIPIMIMPFLGLIASILATKVYEARMTILVQEPSRMNPFLNDLSVGTNVKDRVVALNALLHSEHVIGKVLTDIQRVGPTTPPRERAQLVQELSSQLKMQLIGSELVELSMRSPQPASLRPTLEAVSRRVIERLVSPEQEAVVGSENFLADQMKARRAELNKTEDALSDFQEKNAEKMPALYSVSVTRIASLQQKLEEKSIELSAAEALFDETAKRLAGTNPVVGRMEDKIVELTGELANLRSRYTSEHSQVQGAERRLARLQEERQSVLTATKDAWGGDMDRLWNMAAGKEVGGEKSATPLLISQMQRMQEMEARRASLRQEVEQIRHALAETQRAITQFGPIEQQQKRLERSVTSAREIHDTLSKRYEMARVVGALGRFEAPERIKIIDAPADPTRPLSPPHIIFVLISLIAGIGLGVGLATAAELLDPAIRRAADLASAAGLPLIAVIDFLDGTQEERGVLLEARAL
jgi:polysaccharide chain length determinant protein (PEP-CTERM system associated)